MIPVNWRRKAAEIYAWEVNAINEALGGAGVLRNVVGKWDVFDHLYCEVSTQLLLDKSYIKSVTKRDLAGVPGGPSEPPPGFDLFVRFSTESHPYNDSYRFYVLVRYPDDGASWSVAFSREDLVFDLHIDRNIYNSGRANIIYKEAFSEDKMNLIFSEGKYAPVS
jgi:hypothetical protein